MVSRLALWQSSVARLRTIPGPGPVITVFEGEVPGKPPLLKVGANVDQSRRVAPYVVAFASGGNPLVEPDLGDTADELAWSLRLVVAAGFEADLLDAADRIHAWLFRWSPTINGTQCGPLKPPPGYDPAVRRFDEIDPIRFEMPLQYQLIATT